MSYQAQQTQLTPPVTSDDHIQGPDSAPITLVEYGDFQCPYCGQAFRTVKQLQDEFGDKLRFVYRDFPLTDVHPHAEPAAEAAEAAGGQGKFWPMFDMLYEHQKALTGRAFEEYARQIGLDLQQFETDLAGHRYFDRVKRDFESGVQSGVQGTPTFFINGELYEGSWDYDSLRGVLRDLLR